jgi:hypothetical protein
VAGRPGALPRAQKTQDEEELFMELSTIGWNQEARDKILLDADRALQGAVKEAVETMDGKSRDEVYEFLFQKLQPQFVDFKPGPDLSACADAVANGDVALEA